MKPAAYFRIGFPPHKETFIIKLIEEEKIEHARALLQMQTTRKPHISGKIIKRAASYNQPWSFHLIPESIQFFDISTEVCDASVVNIEEHLAEVGGAFLPNSIWCPWASKVVEEVELTLKDIHHAHPRNVMSAQRQLSKRKMAFFQSYPTDFPFSTHIDLGRFGFIDYADAPDNRVDIWVNLTADGLEALQRYYNIKDALEVNEFNIKRISGNNKVVSYIEDRIKSCRPSGEVIAKFDLESAISYQKPDLHVESDIHNFDTTSSGVCTIAGAAITAWRSWFTSHFYNTINKKVPDIIRQENLPIDSMWVENGLLKTFTHATEEEKNHLINLAKARFGIPLAENEEVSSTLCSGCSRELKISAKL